VEAEMKSSRTSRSTVIALVFAAACVLTFGSASADCPGEVGGCVDPPGSPGSSLKVCYDLRPHHGVDCNGHTIVGLKG
jgi:hypothetical protein